MPVVDHPFPVSFALPVESKRAALLDRLVQLPIGLSEWAVHSSIDTEEIRAVDDGLTVRASDMAFLLSREAREMSETEGITHIDYRQDPTGVEPRRPRRV